jgi:hypothetical protein
MQRFVPLRTGLNVEWPEELDVSDIVQSVAELYRVDKILQSFCINEFVLWLDAAYST